jgi:hypothetical protein
MKCVIRINYQCPEGGLFKHSYLYQGQSTLIFDREGNGHLICYH